MVLNLTYCGGCQCRIVYIIQCRIVYINWNNRPIEKACGLKKGSMFSLGDVCSWNLKPLLSPTFSFAFLGRLFGAFDFVKMEIYHHDLFVVCHGYHHYHHCLLVALLRAVFRIGTQNFTGKFIKTYNRCTLQTMKLYETLFE